MHMYNREYNFKLEVWEILTSQENKVTNSKLVGTREINVVAEDDKLAIDKAWKEANESLTHSYFYRLIMNK